MVEKIREMKYRKSCFKRKVTHLSSQNRITLILITVTKRAINEQHVDLGTSQQGRLDPNLHEEEEVYGKESTPSINRGLTPKTNQVDAVNEHWLVRG